MYTGKSRKERTAQRNKNLKEDFDKLYNVKRIRTDDVIETLASRYHIAPATIQRIIFWPKD
jgi:hypothetical protein